jgi:tetratricopeptide (TPR) repeat protein
MSMELARRAFVLWIVAALPSLAHQAIERGDFNLAVNCLDTYLSFDADNVNVRLTLVDLLATCPDAEVQNLARADELARPLDLHSAGTHRTYAVLAAAHARRGDLKRAIAWQQRALACRDHLDKEEKRRTALVLKLYRTRQKLADKAASRRAKTSGRPQQDGGQ